MKAAELYDEMQGRQKEDADIPENRLGYVAFFCLIVHYFVNGSSSSSSSYRQRDDDIQGHLEQTNDRHRNNKGNDYCYYSLWGLFHCLRRAGLRQELNDDALLLAVPVSFLAIDTDTPL